MSQAFRRVRSSRPGDTRRLEARGVRCPPEAVIVAPSAALVADRRGKLGDGGEASAVGDTGPGIVGAAGPRSRAPARTRPQAAGRGRGTPLRRAIGRAPTDARTTASLGGGTRRSDAPKPLAKAIGPPAVPAAAESRRPSRAGTACPARWRGRGASAWNGPGR